MPGFNGMRVLSFESRRAEEIAQLIKNNGGVPIVAPSTREVPAPGEDTFQFVRETIAGGFEILIFTTGVGARAMVDIAASLGLRDDFLAALTKTRIVVRGPKPAGVMREFKVPIWLNAPEPNTWREIVQVLDGQSEIRLKGVRIGIQEHGEASTEMHAALHGRSAEIYPAHVYRWELPEDVEPLRAAVRAVCSGGVDVVLFTSSIQLAHANEIANQLGLQPQFPEGLKRTVVASIGPSTSSTLREHGLVPDLEPSHPRMGFLVKEAAEKSAALLSAKSAG